MDLSTRPLPEVSTSIIWRDQGDVLAGVFIEHTFNRKFSEQFVFTSPWVSGVANGACLVIRVHFLPLKWVPKLKGLTSTQIQFFSNGIKRCFELNHGNIIFPFLTATLTFGSNVCLVLVTIEEVKILFVNGDFGT